MPNVVGMKTEKFQLKVKCLKKAASYALISAFFGGLTPGTYGGIARDLLTFVANFWPRTRSLDHFFTLEARYTGKDPRDL